MAVPELLGFQINHRAMRGEVRRLAGLATELAAGRQSADAARTTAIAGFITTLSHGIHHHHTMEDQLLWPAIQRSAGAEVDLRDLSDDHSELDSLLAELNDQAAAFVSTGDASALAVSLTRLADMLDEHITEEERLIFPIIKKKYVSVAEEEGRGRGPQGRQLQGRPAEDRAVRQAGGAGQVAQAGRSRPVGHARPAPRRSPAPSAVHLRAPRRRLSRPVRPVRGADLLGDPHRRRVVGRPVPAERARRDHPGCATGPMVIDPEPRPANSPSHGRSSR